MKIDTFIGMGFSNLIAFFIMLTTAATLHAHGYRIFSHLRKRPKLCVHLPADSRFFFLALALSGLGCSLSQC